jgi:hypothetical protein
MLVRTHNGQCRVRRRAGPGRNRMYGPCECSARSIPFPTASSEDRLVFVTAPTEIGLVGTRDHAGERPGMAVVVLWAVVAAGWWLVVGIFSWWTVPSDPVRTFIPRLAEPVPWLLAASSTAALVAVVLRPGVRRVLAVNLVLALGAAGCGLGTNWSELEPRTYFAIHRADFAAVAQLIRAGRFVDLPAGGTRRLPRSLAGLSDDGLATMVPVEGAGGGGGNAVVLTEPRWWFDIDSGYVYLPQRPPGSSYLASPRRPLDLRRNLGGGWWWAA